MHTTARPNDRPQQAASALAHRRQRPAGRRWATLPVAIAAALAVLAAAPATAMDVTWLGGTGNWELDTRWSSSTVPNSTADQVYVNGVGGAPSWVTINSGISIGSLSIDAQSAVSVGGGGSLSIYGGLITNNGRLDIAGSNNTGYAYLQLAGNTTLAGSGNTLLSTSTNGYGGYLLGNGNTLTIASGHTLSGGGSLSNLNLVNQGTLLADSTTPLSLSLSGGTVNNTAGLVKIASGSILTLDSGTLSGGTLQGLGNSRFTGSGVYKDLTLAGTLLVAGGTSTFVAGTLTNTGRLDIAGSNNTGYAYLQLAGNTTLAGGGSTVISTDSYGYSGQILGNGYTLTIASGHTLSGGGSLSNLNLVNQGTLLADSTTPLSLALSGGTVNNTAGLIKIASGSTFSLDNGTLSGGTVMSTGAGPGTISGSGIFENLLLTGPLALSGSITLNNVGLSGNVTVVGGASVYTRGTLTNTGRLDIAGSSNTGYAYLQLAGNTTLAGSGSTLLSTSTNGYGGYLLGNGNTLTIASGHTLSGGGNLSNLNLVNQGTLLADSTTPLSLSLSGGTVNNTAGLVKIASGSILTLDSGTLSGGTLQGLGNSRFTGSGVYKDLTLAGTLLVAGGTSTFVAGTLTNTGRLDIAGSNNTGYAYLQLAGNTTLAGSGSTVLSTDSYGYSGQILGSGYTLTIASGHTLSGSGTVQVGDAGLVNHGTVAPGADIGKLDIAGALLLASDSKLAIDVAGLARGTMYDWLAVTGDASLDGTVVLNLSGYAGQVGDSFSFLSFGGSRSGMFDAVTADGYTLSLNYGSNEVTATITGISAVPEPQTWALLLLGLGVVTRLARRRLGQ